MPRSRKPLKLRLTAFNPLVQPAPSQATLTLAWSAPKAELNADEHAYIDQGQWIRAVKSYRDRTGVSLLEAKQKVQAAMPQAMTP